MASNNFYDSDSDDFGTRPPFFDGEEYYIWKNRMQVFVKAVDYLAWRAIQNGPFIPTHVVDGLTKEKSISEWTDDDEKKVHPDFRAKHLITRALSNGQFSYVIKCDTAQEMWNKLRDIHEGTGEVKMARIEYLTGQYEVFSMKPGENILVAIRFYDIVHHLASLGKEIPNEELVNKALRCLSKKWRHKVRSIGKSNDLSTMLLVSLFSELREHEQLKLNRLDENDEMHMKKKSSGPVAASSRKKDDDSDDSEGMEIKDLIKLLKKKTSFKQGKKEHKKRGSLHIGPVWISLFLSLCKQLMQFLCIIISLSR